MISASQVVWSPLSSYLLKIPGGGGRPYQPQAKVCVDVDHGTHVIVQSSISGCDG